ncbi:glycine receptor subunit alpha-1-like [Branchiostoma floridae x Branchiostoma japonicum]
MERTYLCSLVPVLHMVVFITTAAEEDTSGSGVSTTATPRFSPPSTSQMPAFGPPLDYEPWVRPQEGGPPVDVRCSVYIDTMGSFSEKTMDFSLTLILGCEWQDQRLANVSSVPWYPPPGFDIWTPVIEAVAKSDDETPPVLSVSHDGSVLRMAWHTMKITCLMQLQAYPLDRQKCSLLFHIRGGVRVLWGWDTYWFPGETPVVTRTSGLHSQLKLESVETFAYVNSLVSPEAICVYEGGVCDYHMSEDCLRKQCTSVEKITTQECRNCNYFGGMCMNNTSEDCESLAYVVHGDSVFTTGELRFTLTRRLSYHLLQTYIPSMSIVAMSWVSFWINMESAPARTGLGVTTVLTMITQSGRIIAMPEVSYVRAVDVWLLGCQLFVFLALIEFAAVNYISRRIRMDGDSENGVNGKVLGKKEGVGLPLPDPLVRSKKKMTGMDIADAVDHFSRIGFPVAFVIFNVLYWALYVVIMREPRAKQ